MRVVRHADESRLSVRHVVELQLHATGRVDRNQHEHFVFAGLERERLALARLRQHWTAGNLFVVVHDLVKESDVVPSAEHVVAREAIERQRVAKLGQVGRAT